MTTITKRQLRIRQGWHFWRWLPLEVVTLMFGLVDCPEEGFPSKMRDILHTYPLK